MAGPLQAQQPRAKAALIVPLTFSDVQAFLKAGLSRAGYVEILPITHDKAMPLIEPGPASEASMQKRSPQAIVFVRLSSGGGLTVEQLYDEIVLDINIIGPQRSYKLAEKLANDVDYVLLQAVGNTQVGETEVLYINRIGGRPALDDFDSADRYHFTGSYVTEAVSDLVR